MTITDWTLTLYCTLFCILWCVFYIKAIPSSLTFPLFEKEHAPEPDHWPVLSIVIAACDEAHTIESAISTLLRQDYPKLEIILINDRSTDRTGQIIDRIAEQDARVNAVHVKDLPAGWLGKVHALHVGTQRVRGEWILFTDADVHFRQGTLRKAVALAMANPCDHFTIGPAVDTPSFWLEVLIRTFGMIFVQVTRVSEVGRPDSDAFVGIGAFNMVRTSALEKTEGFSWLRMEIADDVGLGLMLKRSGAKNGFAGSLRDVSLLWYPSLTAMFKGLEKNIFGFGAYYSVPRMIGILMVTWAAVLAPALALLCSELLHLQVLGAMVYGFAGIAALIGKIRFKWNFLPTLFAHVGLLIISAMLLYSGTLCKMRRGIIWRGTFYPIDDLIAGQRVKLL